ncbi:MAG: hypothetical protein H6Q73_151 [Firmicutes bacterium]|nr:hypothetical protein [Bacillota bacterium]
MLTAVEYLRPVGFGATSPQLFRADDGKSYVVKLQNNRLGPRVLANELLGTRLGERLGLCFPPGGIIKLDDRLIRKSRILSNAHVSPGKHFACQYLNGTQYLCVHNLHKAINKPEMAGVMLFDHMLHNLDRTMNRRNLLLRREEHGYKIYAIDNSHLFRSAIWSEERLRRLATRIQVNHQRSYGALLKKFLRPAYFETYFAKVKDISDGEFQELVATIPTEWLPHASERETLCQFLSARRDMAEEIITCLCSLIPNKHRCSNIDQGK